MKKLLASLALGVGMCLCAAPASAAIIVKFTPSSQHINVDESATVDVSIEGLGAEILSAYDLNFKYNPAILNWQVITQFLAPFNVNSSAMNGMDQATQGDLGFFLNSLDSNADLASNQANDILLFTFTFRGIADGSTIFGLGSDLDFERNFVGLDPDVSLLVTVEGACIAVGTGECGTVPEPSTLSLLGLALVGATMIGMRRRRIA